MIPTASNRVWALEPNVICETFPSDPVTNYLNSVYKWKVKLGCTLNKVGSGDSCIISILPSYIALDIHKEKLYFTTSYGDNTSEYKEVLIPIHENLLLNISIEHIPNKNLVVFINNKEAVKFDLTSKSINVGTKTCVVIGSNTFLPTDQSRNSDLTLHNFSVTVNDVVKSDHDFKKIIFNKSYDKTENLNFLHTYNE